MLGYEEKTRDLIEGWVEVKGRRQKFLEAIEELIDWRTVNSKIEKLYANRGRPSIAPLKVFKMLLLQHFYNLSDPECEDAVTDSLSFRKFCKIGITDKVPDETTLVRFRQRLIKRDLHRKLLELVNVNLAEHGLMVNKVTLVDASLIEAQTKRPSKGKDAIEKEASYTVKNEKVHYGYKAHIASEAATGMIKKAEYTTAKVHDSQVFENFDDGKTPIAADKAYWSEARNKQLGERSYLQIRGKRNKNLCEIEKAYNKQVSKIRSRIEKIFGYMKRSLGYGRSRYRGLSPGLLELQMKSICWNLRRAVTLMQ
jgi:transposase, IS5 family